jgi:hypothetical protein
MEAGPPGEVRRLEDEVAHLRSRLDRREAWQRRARRAAMAALLFLGCALIAASAIALFVRATVLDTDRYVRTMAPIAESPAVQRAVAERLDAAIAQRVDFDALMRDALPDRADPLAPALADALRRAIRTRLDEFVASDTFPRLWNEANRRAHTRVVALLTTGESERLGLEDDTVYLDLGGAVESVRQRLEQRGLSRLAEAIPPTVDGRVTLVTSEGFVTARDAVDALETLTIVLPIAALLCLAGYVALARPRRRGLIHVGIGIVLTALLLLALGAIARSAYLDAISREQLPREAAADIFDALFVPLRTILRIVAAAAIVLAVLAFVAGQASSLAARARDAVRPVARGPAPTWVAEHRTVLQGIVIALGAIVIFASEPPTAGLVIVVAAVVAALLALVAAVARAPGAGTELRS